MGIIYKTHMFVLCWPCRDNTNDLRYCLGCLKFGMALIGFILYGYGYWRLNFDTDNSQFPWIAFFVGLVLFTCGIGLLLTQYAD